MAFVPFGNQTRDYDPWTPGRHFGLHRPGRTPGPFINGGRVASGTDKRQRGVTVTVRLTAEERARLDELSSRSGLAAGAFMRAATFGNPGPRAQRRPPADHEALRRILGELGHVGSNINQIARAVNTDPQGADLSALPEALAAYLQIRDAIFDALGMRTAHDNQGQQPGGP